MLPVRCRAIPRMRLVAAAEMMLLVTVLLGGCDSPGPAPLAVPTGVELGAAVDGFVDESLSPGLRNRRAILVAVNGKTVVERYYDSGAGESDDLASVTKSFLSTLVGIAVSEGVLELDQNLDELLPSYADVMTPQVGAITVRQLLTMTAGLPADGAVDPRPSGEDWVADIVRRGTVQPPGQGFAVLPAWVATYRASRSRRPAGRVAPAIARAGRNPRRGLRPAAVGLREGEAVRSARDRHHAQHSQPVLTGVSDRVEARQIQTYDKAGFAWPRDPQGINVGYGTMKMTAADMVKLGNLYLHKGAWEGEQLVPSGWIEEATSSAVSTGDGGFGGPGYGYQWWVTTSGDHPAFAAIGYGGQNGADRRPSKALARRSFSVHDRVVPDLRLVVVASTWLRATPPAVDSRIWQTMVDLAIVPAIRARRRPDGPPLQLLPKAGRRSDQTASSKAGFDDEWHLGNWSTRKTKRTHRRGR